MTPITKNGKPPIIPTATYCAGSKATDARENAAISAKLIHHGERSRIANNDFSDILNFMACLLICDFAR